jgi:hypothetical protein
VIVFDSFVREVLDPACKNPFELLKQYKPFLHEISFGLNGKENKLIGNFFDVEEYTGEEHEGENFEDIINE